MDVTIIDTSGLGDRSYLVCEDNVAAVIDPQRDIDRVLELAADRGATITHVLETHIHNDYITGGLELARTVDAEYVVAAGDDVGYDRRAVGDGDVIDVGPFRFFSVMHTPGHTHHHVSYVLHDAAGKAAGGVFTGGSMLHGTTGRTDLIGAEYTKELTHAQFHSVRRLAAELTDDVQIYPTHGFGSFCSASPASGDSSTIAQERTTNPALTNDEQTYVDQLIAGLSDYPAYYAHMGVINADGPAPVDLSLPEPVDAAELRRRIDAGEWVVDLRSRTAFAARHLSGTMGFELSTQFVTYLGWLYAWGAPADARRRRCRPDPEGASGVVPHRCRQHNRLGRRRYRGFGGRRIAGGLPRRRLRRPGQDPRRGRSHRSRRAATPRIRRQSYRRSRQHSAARVDRSARPRAARAGMGSLRIRVPGLDRCIADRLTRTQRGTRR